MKTGTVKVTTKNVLEGILEAFEIHDKTKGKGRKLKAKRCESV
jgi:hypothetical protein